MTINKISALAEKMGIGISRSEKNNTWTMTTTTMFGLCETVFNGNALEFLSFLENRFSVCSK